MQAQKERTADEQFQILVRGPHKKPPSKPKPDPAAKSKPLRSAKDQNGNENPATR
jgi:hypothetical protein